MPRSLSAALVVVAMASFLPAHGQAATTAQWLDISGVSHDEECLVYTLQGLVNREAPRLMLDAASIFWSWPPSDRYWRTYLEREKGFSFEELADLRAAISHFRPHLNGLVLYDPAEDASRYVAVTLCAQRGLLPVTPDILAYRTPALSSSFWTGDDMTDASRWYASGAQPEAIPGGVQLRETALVSPYGAMDRKLTVDLQRAPLLEIEVTACTAQWALKVNEGTPVDAFVQTETSSTGTFRYDLRSALQRPRGSVILRIFTVGEGSTTLVRSLRLLDADGNPVAADGGSRVDCFADLPVVEDLRGRFGSDLEAYDWALEKLLPGCDHTVAFSAGHSHPGAWLGGDPAITIGMDYGVSRRAFTFNLSPVETGFESYGHKDPRGFPEQAAMFTRIMESLDRPAAVYGWSEPEWNYCNRVSRAGNFVMCCGAPNMSFWAKVPSDGPARLPRQSTPGKQLQDKYYVIFQTNEGDTPKIVASAFCGAWADPARGSIPISWGINPLIGREFPALFEFFARTATPSDSFFAGCSGAGYCFPFHMPNLDQYAAHVADLTRTHGPRVIDLWENGMRLDLYEQYRSAAHPACFTQQTIGAATNNWLTDGTPVITADTTLYYFDLQNPLVNAQDLAHRIQKVAQRNPAPFFIVCYGGVGSRLYGYAQGVRDLLPASEFEIIGVDDMADLARQAGAFSARSLALGVAQGQPLELAVAVRNPDGDLSAPGDVSLELPEGWHAELQRWAFDAVPQGGCREQTLRVVAGDQAQGDAVVVACDSRTGATRRVPVSVYRETRVIGEFDTEEGWRETGAKLALEGGQAVITTPEPYASVQRTIEIDFDRDPVIEVDVSRTGGAWALKINDGTLPTDINLQLDNSSTGMRAYDLSLATGWHGKKTCQVILFAIGQGTSTRVERVCVHYRR